jgi:hypothetical protein
VLRHDVDQQDALQQRLAEYAAAQEPVRLAREAFATANMAEAVAYTREVRLKQIFEIAQERDDRAKVVSDTGSAPNAKLAAVNGTSHVWESNAYMLAGNLKSLVVSGSLSQTVRTSGS